ncbi:MAG: hypothetical protein AAGH87_09450 [Pseudomonadota bacterium]
MFEKITLGSVGFADIEKRLGVELTERILNSADPFIDQKLLDTCDGKPLSLDPLTTRRVLDKSDDHMHRTDINEMFLAKYGA